MTDLNEDYGKIPKRKKLKLILEFSEGITEENGRNRVKRRATARENQEMLFCEERWELERNAEIFVDF